MKNLFCLILLIPTVVFSQFKVDTLNQKVFYSNIYEVNMVKKDIHHKIFEWIALNFNDSNNVLKLNTEDKLIVKGLINLDKNYPMTKWDFALDVTIRDNKYKLDINFDESKTVYGGNTTIMTIKDFIGYLNFDTYANNVKKIYQDEYDNMTDKSLKKYFKIEMDKALNPSKLEFDFQVSKASVNLQLIQMEVFAKTISTDIFNYITTKTNDNW